MKYILIGLSIIVLDCKKKATVTQDGSEIIPIETQLKNPSDQKATLETIAGFLNITPIDSLPMESRLTCWGIDPEGNMTHLETNNGMVLYNQFMGTEPNRIYPLFGTTDSNLVMVLLTNERSGGRIKGSFLIDRSTLEVKKVVLEHQATSEGYGSEIALPSFENQFVGAKIQLTKNSFGLNQNGKTIIEGTKTIDGISGATTTSRHTIEMVNYGLKRYRTFFLTQ